MALSTNILENARRALAGLQERSTKDLSTAISSLVVLLVALLWYRSYVRLSHFPGPKLAAWTKLPLIYWMTAGKAHLDFLRLTEAYGPLVRIAPNVLLSSDPEFMRRIGTPRSPYRRNEWYMAFRFNPKRDHIGSCRDEEQHSALRAKMAQGYSGKEIIALEEKIDRNVVALMELIESRYLSDPGETKPFDFAQKSQYFTMDTIGDISFGDPFGFLTKDQDMYDYLKTSAEAFPFFTMLSMFPALVKILAWDVLQKYLPSAKDQLGFGRIMGIAQERADQHFASKNDELHQDMMGSFVRHGLTREEAESESVLQVLAGAETTATALRTTLFYVVANPRVHAKLRAELAKARPSSPIPDEEARKLPYLQAVIKEGLRMCPPITGLAPKDVPPGGDTYDGMFIPGGTVIGYSSMAVVRERKLWGDDADSFRPERFLEGPEEVLKRRDAALETVFGFGRWRCLGRSIALIELNKAIVEMVRHFDLSIVNPTNPFKSWNAGIHVQSDMWMRASRPEGGC